MPTTTIALRSTIAAALFAFFIALTGCGGGGGSSGGGGGGGTGGGSNIGSLVLNITSPDVLFTSRAPNFGQPQPEIVSANLMGTGKGTLYIIITPSDPAVASVSNIVISGNGGSGNIVAGNAAALGLGTHTATITVRACVDDITCTRNEIAGSPKTINVTYIVDGTLISVPSLTFNIGNAPVAADFTKTFTVGHYPLDAWTGSTDVPLLSFAPINSNTLNTSVTASIDPALLDAYDSGVYTGSISVLPGSLAPTATDIPVTLNITRTRVNFVAPYVQQSGTVDDVIIRGRYFNLAPPTGVKFGNVDATNVVVINDTEIHATHPPLAAGVYTVHVNNAQGIDRTTAELHVVDPPTFPAAAMEYPDGPGVIARNLLYDAQRRALFVSIVYNLVGEQTHQLVRYAYSAGAWQRTGQLFIPFDSAYALSADGRTLVLVHVRQPFGLVFKHLDPVTLATTRADEFTNFGNGASSMAVANDGNAIVETGNAGASASFPEVLYSPLRRELSGLLAPARNGGGGIEGRMTVGSGDGSVVMFLNDSYQRPIRYISGSLETDYGDAPEIPDSLISIETDRGGDLFALNTFFVLDSAFRLIGRLPASTTQPVLTPAQRVFALDSGAIRQFDAGGPPVAGILPEILPAITLAQDPGYLAGRRAMTLTPDGGTMFVAGRDRIVVQPLQ